MLMWRGGDWFVNVQSSWLVCYCAVELIGMLMYSRVDWCVIVQSSWLVCYCTVELIGVLMCSLIMILMYCLMSVISSDNFHSSFWQCIIYKAKFYMLGMLTVLTSWPPYLNYHCISNSLIQIQFIILLYVPLVDEIICQLIPFFRCGGPVIA